MRKNRFNKVLGKGDIIVTAFGAMIGWGWVVSSGGWLQRAGALGSVISFIIGGLMIYFIGLVYAELTTAIPKCGGEMVFSYRAFGVKGSYVCTWFLILSYVGVVCFEACSLPTIIQYIFPGFLRGYLYSIAGFDVYFTWLAAAILFAVLIIFVNLIGIKTAAVFQTVLTLVIAVVGIIFVVISAINGSPDNLKGQMLVGDGFFGIAGNCIAIAVVAPFFLFGFDVIPQIAEEIKVPLKKVGQLILLSIILAVLFYALVILAVGYGLNVTEVNASYLSSGLVTADAMAKLFNSEIMAKVMILGGICGIITSWNSFLIGGSRAIYSMSCAKMLPAVFSKFSDKRKTPTNAILLIGVLSVFSVFFGRQMLVWISNTASVACCIAYCIVAMSFLRLRKKAPDLVRPYRIKHYRFVGVIAILMSGILVLMSLIPFLPSSLSYQEWIIFASWSALGCLFYFIAKYTYKNEFGVISESELL